MTFIRFQFLGVVCLPVIAVYVVDVDGAEGEGDVDDDEDEEEDHDVEDHVRHADDDRTRLTPHQPDLNQFLFSLFFFNEPPVWIVFPI